MHWHGTRAGRFEARVMSTSYLESSWIRRQKKWQIARDSVSSVAAFRGEIATTNCTQADRRRATAIEGRLRGRTCLLIERERESETPENEGKTGQLLSHFVIRGMSAIIIAHFRRAFYATSPVQASSSAEWRGR